MYLYACEKKKKVHIKDLILRLRYVCAKKNKELRERFINHHLKARKRGVCIKARQQRGGGGKAFQAVE